jgi:hypothetical protein
MFNLQLFLINKYMDYKYIYLLLLTLLIFYIISRYFSTKETFKSTINDVNSTKDIKKNDFNFIKQEFINKNKKINNINEKSKSTENFLESFLDVMTISNNLLSISTNTSVTGTLAATGNITTTGTANIGPTAAGQAGYIYGGDGTMRFSFINGADTFINSPNSFNFWNQTNGKIASIDGSGNLSANGNISTNKLIYNGNLSIKPGAASPDTSIFSIGDGTGWRINFSKWDGNSTGTYIYDNGNVNVGQNLSVAGTLSVGSLALNNPTLNGTTTFGINTWHKSTDGAMRMYYGNNGRSYFGSKDGYEFRSPTDVNIATLDSSGNLTNTGNHTVNGQIYIPNGVNLTKNFQSLSSNTASEISNDTGTFKTLMILGNTAAGGQRNIGMWDNVNISNNLNVGGGITAQNSTIVGTLGIMYPGQSYYTCSMRTTAAGAISIGCDNIRFVDSNHNQNAGNVTFGGNVNVVGQIYNPNGVNLTKNWQNTANGSAAEISNDTSGFKMLMIVGNSSAGGQRTIGMWDVVNVYGTLNVSNNINTTTGLTYMPVIARGTISGGGGGNIYCGNSGACTLGTASNLVNCTISNSTNNGSFVVNFIIKPPSANYTVMLTPNGYTNAILRVDRANKTINGFVVAANMGNSLGYAAIPDCDFLVI